MSSPSVRNILMASLMNIIAEAHVFASKTGLPSATLERLLELNFGPVAYSDSVRMTTGVYCPGVGQAPWSDLELGIKDVGHGIATAEREGVSLKTGKTALDRLKKASQWAKEVGNSEGQDGLPRRLDSSGLFGVVRMESGLEFETELVKDRDGKANNGN
jgi:3-hydroxyisobutyrate dehydrogenase-like beta-hydroxyacid dehydrogenase